MKLFADFKGSRGQLRQTVAEDLLFLVNRPRVKMAVMLRCAGWNVFRALAAFKKRGIRDFAALAAAFCHVFGDLGRRQTSAKLPHSPLRPFPRQLSPPPVRAAA